MLLTEKTECKGCVNKKSNVPTNFFTASFITDLPKYWKQWPPQPRSARIPVEKAANLIYCKVPNRQGFFLFYQMKITCRQDPCVQIFFQSGSLNHPQRPRSSKGSHSFLGIGFCVFKFFLNPFRFSFMRETGTKITKQNQKLSNLQEVLNDQIYQNTIFAKLPIAEWLFLYIFKSYLKPGQNKKGQNFSSCTVF